MRLAAIDIGTNSTRLLLGDYSRDIFSILERKMRITRLGSGLGENNTISKDSADKTLDILKTYNKLIESYNVNKCRAVGTSALRTAKNRSDFISSAEKILGIRIDVIGGDEEARLSFYGATKDIIRDYNKSGGIGKVNSKKILVLDVGGGSSEFILGEKSSRPDFIKSVDIGCVNISERYMNSDIPDAGQLNKMNNHIRKKLETTIKKIKNLKAGYLIGVAGTISTLASIDLRLDKYDSDRIHKHILEFGKIKEIYSYLCGLNLEDRKKVRGMDPGRADVIIGGTAIVINVLEMLGSEFICASEKDILDGIIYTLIDF
ncbi:MAG: Ppx/GppA phosphatase family protein [Actinomycetota bacterium]|nr:Ppx/GppA phosphatase family protein [Actinomycetota bacterium]